MASLAGSWSTLVEGFGGLRERGELLALDPRLPEGIERLTFRLRRQGARLLVDVDHDRVRCSLRDGDGEARLCFLLYDEPVEITAARPVERAVVPIKPLLSPPKQPPGRTPLRHGARP
jgi:trehalose/maltose hydrolase-like predicted phosphorylase